MSGEAFVTLVVLGIVIMIVVFIAGRSRRSRSGHNDNLAIQAGRRVEPASAPSTAEDNVNASVSRKSYESSTPEMTITPKLQTLIRELEDPNDERRASAAREIGRLGDVGGVEPLIEALAEGQTNNVEGEIARALGDIGDPKAVEVLVQTVLFALDDYPSAEEMRESNSLLMSGYDTWEYFNPQPQTEATRALKKIGDPHAVTVLTEALTSKTPGSAMSAASALGNLGDPNAARHLVKALQEEETRGFAAIALGELGNLQAVEPLMRLLLQQPDEEDADLREYAATLLGRLGDPRTVEPLIGLLGIDEDGVGSAAASALGQIGDQRAVAPLIEALKDPNSVAMRVQAALAFGYLGNLRAMKPLVEMLKAEWDGSSGTRRAAARALGEIGDTGELSTPSTTPSDTPRTPSTSRKLTPLP